MHNLPLKYGPILACLLPFVASCASVQPAATKVITVTQTTYIPIPANLLIACPPGNAAAIATNSDLLDAFLADQAALATCTGQIKAIAGLTSPK